MQKNIWPSWYVEKEVSRMQKNVLVEFIRRNGGVNNAIEYSGWYGRYDEMEVSRMQWNISVEDIRTNICFEGELNILVE